jgi:PAS domain S-box-containing protein
VNTIVETQQLIPHSHCYLWQPELLGLHLVGDSLIALAYYSIALTLLYFIHKRQDLPFKRMFLLFVGFILGCGTIHLMDIWTLWYPTYWLSGGIKAITAVLSVYTAVDLVPLIPKAVALKSVTQLETANQELEREINERKRVEQALQESQELFRRAFNDAAIGMALIAPNGRWLKVNNSLCESIGYTELELLSMSNQDITHPNDLEIDLNYIKLLLANEIRTYQIEKRYFHKQGHVVWILLSVSLVRNVEDEPLYFIAQIQDITARKRTERDLELHSIIIKNMGGGVCLVKAIEQTIVYANPKFESMFGYAPGELKGKPVDIVNYEDEAHSAKLTAAKIIGEIERYAEATYEVQNVKKDGTPFWCQAHASVFEDPEYGRVYVTVQEDITKHKNAEVALHQALLKAQEASIAKSRFLSRMSHELRTPLNVILGFSQILARSNSLSSQEKEHLQIINRSGEHLLHIINDILSMSKIEAGQVTLNENSFDLYQVLQDLEQMLQLEAALKGLELIFERSANTPQYIQTDESKLRQVLINLLGNAIKFTKSGTVILRVRMGSNNGTQPQASTTSNILHFEVQDTGPGIAPDAIATLFEPFVQTETGRQSMQGTGLGLPISRQFVQLMGGDINVNSQLGQGTIFKFNIAISETGAIDSKALHTNKQIIGLKPNQPTYRILVVEDLEESRLLLINLLKPLGFQLREAVNGAEAIAMWSMWEPHLIWMDIRMPVMDGYEATRQIKATQNGQDTKIIALTASAFDEDQAKILSSGCDDFICKPLRESVLYEKMAQHLGIEYIYLEQSQLNVQPRAAMPRKITPKDLSVMPSQWLAQMHHGILCANDQLILKLIEEIPQTEAFLAHNLRDMVNNFRLDLLLDLVQRYIHE